MCGSWKAKDESEDGGMMLIQYSCTLFSEIYKIKVKSE